MVKGGRGPVAYVVGDECGRVCNNVTKCFIPSTESVPERYYGYVSLRASFFRARSLFVQ